MINNFSKIIILSFAVFLFALPLITNAQDSSEETPFNQGLKQTGVLTGYNTEEPDEYASLANPVIKLVMPFIGIVYFMLVMYGGYLWMTAAGNDDQIGKAKKIIVSSTLGLLVVMLAYAISWFIFSKFSEGYIE